MGITPTSRPLSATALAVLQTMIAGANVLVAVVVLIAMRAPEVAPHATETVHEMTLDIAMVGVSAVLTTLASVGLWKRWALGWALTLALGLTVVLGLLWGPLFDHDYMSGTERVVTLAFSLAILLALLPAVRHWYLRHNSGTPLSADNAKLKSGY